MTNPEAPKLQDPEISELDPTSAEQPPISPKISPRPKSRWFRHVSLASGLGVFAFAALILVLFLWASSAAFEDSVRRRIIAALEDSTGGRVEIASFHWNLLHLSAEASGLTIHGLEASTEAPYAHVERLQVQISVLDLFTIGSPTHVILHQADIYRPSFHLIVYPDGSTNQPQPRHPAKLNKPVMDTLFEAQIGKLTIEQGSLHIANQTVPLELEAHDTDLQLAWLPDTTATVAPPSKATGSYRIHLSLAQLAFAQGKGHPLLPSRIDADLLLHHDSAQLQSLRLVSLDRILVLTGTLSDFRHAAWQAQASGQVDLRILGPYADFLNTRSGIVTLHASATGRGSDFQATGDLASDAIHYQDPVVDAQTAAFAARFRADARQLLVTDTRIHLKQGGEVDGQFQYDNWLDSTPAPAVAQALRREHKTWPIPTGIVRAHLSGVTLDTVLAMLAIPAYQHLGLDTQVNGPATADWTGLGNDLAIGAKLALQPSNRAIPGEAPLQGSLDATYHDEKGSIDVRSLDVHLPHTTVQGNGTLGVYPIDRVSAMNLDFASSNLSDLDGVLRALGLREGNRVGTAALPVTVAGQANFHGQLNSSWLTPRVEGHLTATNIAVEIPTATATAAAPTPTPTYLHWDSVDVDGLYSAPSIVVHHGVFKRGNSSLTLQGHLDSQDPNYNLGKTAPEFDGNATVSLQASAQQFPLSEILPLAGVTDPIDGKLTAQLKIDGQLKSLSGSGSVDVAKATLYGESIDRVHATGSVSGQLIKITSLTASQSGGQLTGTGSYDLAHRGFRIDARGTAIDLGSLQQIQRSGSGVTGKLGFTLAGDGTLSDPRLQAHANLTKMAVSGEPVADIQFNAISSQRAVTYDLRSHQPAGDLTGHGVTSFTDGYQTQASLQLSKFDIGALLKLLKVTGITGQSNLEGTANISGPLAHPEKLRGEASLRTFAVNVEGVHLQSKGAVHTSLYDGILHLDPLEITGEDTDLRLRGSLSILGKQQLDLQADGSVNLRLAESVDPDLIASGATRFQMEAHGPLVNPILQGKVEFQNASLALQDFPNGLSQIKGTLEFVQNRLEVRSLTAMSGGGQLSVAGYLGFQHGLYADLTATGKSIRVRYPQGVSSLADASLRLQGPQNNLLLSGTVQVTRFAINADLDMASLAAQPGGSVQAIVSPDAPSNHVRLDVHLTSAPQLNFQNAFAKLAGDVDLRLRGTIASPSLLGRISLTQGSTTLAGTRYELQRGDINFSNPVRIQPNIDLDATARVEDYDITLGLHGTPDKLHVTYRSEPPLPEADVIALLALGRTQSEQSSAYAQQQQQAGDNPTTDALLGGALNATVSNRVQKLFGSGAIKVDPNFIGSLGNSTARVTVVEQIGKNLTFTYASNVNTTTQQLIQAEIAINHHVSLLVTQDESGIFSMVVKARRRFR